MAMERKRDRQNTRWSDDKDWCRIAQAEKGMAFDERPMPIRVQFQDN